LKETTTPTPPAKTIDTLVADIYSLLTDDIEALGVVVSDEQIKGLSDELATVIKDRLGGDRRAAYLRLSNLGTPCDRKLWYSIKQPSLAEPTSGATQFKFLYGDILERIVLHLAEWAGHSVTGRQTELTIDGVPGHRDGVIDGRLVDVKSATTNSFSKFREHKLATDDPFGYLVQLGTYLEASQDDEEVTDKDKASFLAIDKQLGHITLDTYERQALASVDFVRLVASKRKLLESDDLPERGYSDIPEGKSGNRRLGVECSYCPFKSACWPGLRTFSYSSGPTYLTKVEREPKVLESGRSKKF
jgi:hypothetical protein